MLSDLFHRSIYHLAVITVIATVWVSAWSKALVDEANRRWWPPLPTPRQIAEHNSSVAVAEP
jgi:hypothetical protein